MIQFFDAFISYGRADSKAFAEKLHKRLTEEGFKVWFDQRDIPYGVDYQCQIDDGIEKAHNFIFIIAPHSVKSPYCRKEIELAVKRHKRIIPLLHVKADEFKEQTHPIIRQINWLWFQEGINDFEKSFTDLIKVIQNHEDYVKQHTQFLAKALEWERNQKQTSYLLIREEKQQAETWLKIRFKDEQPPCLPTDLHCEYITESIKNANNLMTQVFISYAEEDRTTMEKICNSLRRESITVWTNETDIQTGEALEEAIKRGIEQADNVVYLLSPDSVKSYFTRQELEYALSLNKRIIPVLVREISSESIPNALQDLQYIDLTDNVKEEDYHLDESELLRILRQDEAYYNEHKILLTKALKWKRQHENPSILLRGYNLRSAETWLKVASKRTLHPPTPLMEEFIAESLRQPPAISLDVFVSYSRADSDFARKLNDELQLQGKTTWFDQESIASGADFAQEIKQGIQACDNFLFILSPRSVNSPYCADEVEYAAGLHKRFVTVLNRQVNSEKLHPELAKVQWIDFNQNPGDFLANFRQLVRTLDTDREHLHNHTKWSQRAIEWKENHQSADLLLRGSEFAIAEHWMQESEQQKKQPAATPLQKDYITASREAIEAAKKREKRQVIRLRSLLGLVSIGFFISIGIGVFAFTQWRRAEIVQEGQISSLSQYSLALSDKDRKFDALIEAIRAGRQLQKQLNRVNPEARSLVLTALQAAVYGDGFREQTRLTGINGHSNDVNSVSFSPDGKTIASASRDKTAKLWSLNGKVLQTLPHDNDVHSVSFSPDGKLIATASNKAVKLWSQDGQELKTLPHNDWVNSVSFSPDGKLIATASNKAVKLWSQDGQELKALPHNDWVNSVSFSPDGKLIATASGKAVKLWSYDGKELKSLPHNDWVNSVSFSPDGKLIATASSDKTLKIWSLKGELLQTLPHDNEVSSISFSPDGQYMVSASRDKIVKLWSRDGKELQTLSHDASVNSVSFSPDGKLIATASYEVVKLWSRDGKKLQTLSHDASVNSVSFSPDGKLIATASNKAVKLWSYDGKELKSLPHNNWVTSISFSSNGKTIVSADGDGKVKLWSLEGRLLHTFPHKGWVNSVSFSPDDKLIASASEDGKVRIWSSTGELLQTFSHDDDVNSVSFSPDSKIVASVSNDDTLKLWRRDRKEPKIFFNETPFKSVSFSPNGKMIAAAGIDGTVRLFSVEGELLQTFKGHHEQVKSVSFSPDSKTLASASKDGTVILWNLEDLRFDKLMQDACTQVEDYLKNSAPESDRALCDGISEK
jgi:WD40 repeat protein